MTALHPGNHDLQIEEHPSQAAGGDWVCVVEITGEIDAGNASTLTDRFNELLGNGNQRYVVDLGGVGFMDSSGISAMVQLFKRVRIGHGDVKLSNIRPEVSKVLELLRLNRVFEIHETTTAAVDSFGD